MNATEISAVVAKIEAELDRLGWLASNDRPCACVVDALPNLPKGWVRVADDYSETHGDAEKILTTLRKAQPEDVELNAAGLSDFADGAPTNSRDWPEDLIGYEPQEEGTVNDQPVTLIRIETNAGTRWAIGPHGVFNCALADALKADSIYTSREEAIESYDWSSDAGAEDPTDSE